MQKEKRRFSTPTLIDVARESGVSYSTVSRALSGFEYVKPSTRERVLEAAEKLGYVPNSNARSLAGGRSNLIGVLIPGVDNGYFAEIIRGIDEELAKSDYNLVLYTTHRRRDKESTYVTTILNGAVEGLILVVPLLSATYLNMLRQQSFPYVMIDQSDTEEKSSIVNGSNWQGAYDATQYLIELGHKRIACITGLMGISTAVERLKGYTAALKDHDIPLRSPYIAEGGFEQRGGYDAAHKLLTLPQPPTAIFVSNDLSAFGAIEAIRELGLRIPEDISVIGFDDIPQASITYPKLTTVHQPLEQMGRTAVELLLGHIDDPDRLPRRVALETRLIVRDSCQPPKHS